MKGIFLTIFVIITIIASAQVEGMPYHFCALNGSCYNDNDRKVTFEENEYTPDEIIHLTELFQNAHPEFEIIVPTSMKYNCHGYAYSAFQGGSGDDVMTGKLVVE